MKKKTKRVQDMNAEELARATKEFDEPFVFEKARPMNAREREAWRLAKRGRGRPKVGNGSKKINVSIDLDLLKDADRLARKQRINRSQILANALRAYLVPKKVA